MMENSRARGFPCSGLVVLVATPLWVVFASGCELIVRISPEDMRPRDGGADGRVDGTAPGRDGTPTCGPVYGDGGGDPLSYVCPTTQGATCETCLLGCGSCLGTNGDGKCDGCLVNPETSTRRECNGSVPENHVNAPDDCYCGNGHCDWYESCKTCSRDCGSCWSDQLCQDTDPNCRAWQTKQYCPDRCGGCGNGQCGAGNDSWKNCENCPEDCGYCVYREAPP